jgi:Protein of unknown function (DUF2778)
MGGGSYVSERGEPRGPRCENYGLLFDAFFLKLSDGSRLAGTWPARSGRIVEDKFDYTKARQAVKDEGPIPEGSYWIEPSQLTHVSFGTGAWGRYRITIHPLPLTVSYGRGGVFIHGGDEFGSAGCIDLAHGIDAFVTALRRLLPTPGVRRPGMPTGRGGGRDATAFVPCIIPLTVRYGASSVPLP